MRVAAIQPAQPGPGSDPYEDGLDIEVVTEATPVTAPDYVPAIGESSDAGFDPWRRGGNTAVTTGFSSTPAASSLSEPPRQQFSSPFARAMTSYALR